jgi:hypothetical protein
MKKGTHLHLEKTLGSNQGDFDLYDLKGLSLGKVYCIKAALTNHGSAVAKDIIDAINKIDNRQTIGGKY